MSESDGIAKRENLICSAGRKGVAKTGKIIAATFGVPLVDHATSMHRKKQKILATKQRGVCRESDMNI